MLNKLLKGDKRSVMAKKNVLASVLIKGADTLVYLLLVPLTLGYLNAYEYGIWLTLSSILAWINSFDIGLGNGLRNKLGEAMAVNDKDRARGYVSTTFFMLLVLSIGIFVIFSLIIDILDWYSILNVDPETVGNLKEVVLVSFFFFCLSFLFKFVGNVYQGLQLPAVNNLIGLGGHLFSFIVIFILRLTVPGSLFWVAVVYSAAFPAVYFLCYPITFYRLYPYLAPSFRFFRREYLKDLFSLGILFFVIQVMSLVLFSMSNVIISNWFGPDQVTPYNIVFKYFSFISIFFGFLLAPIWAASTDAYAKGDMAWIQYGLKKIRKVLLLVAGVIALMIICSGLVYKIWVGDTVDIPIEMSVLMGVYVLLIQYSLAYSSILNGMGKLRLQTINIIVVAILFYPICCLFARFLGVNGIIIGMIVVNLSGAILNTLQLNKILKKKAVGIWLE